MNGLVVSHTHWDRAWYLPFERFRVRLVRLVDRVLDLLERDPDFRAFTLDGQTVLIEDYLAVRPEQQARLEALVRSGRLVVGPFYVLPDLFLVSFESLVRNLQRGFRWRAALGAPDRPVGYVPDPFGQPEVMPQLLRGFDLSFFFFSRGFSEAHRDAGALFRWRGPDGSEVTALYGRDGYFNAGGLGLPGPFGRFEGLVPETARAVAQIEETAERLLPLQSAGVPLLLLNGFDHMPEQPDLPRLLREAHALRPGWRLPHGTLADFAAAAEGATDLPVIEGDLLGNADHPILSSVYSTRLYLKRAHHAAESLLTHIAEPLAALVRDGPDPRPLLDLAWRHLLRAQPHDDLCGCSVDAAHLDTEAAIRHAHETATELLRERLEVLAQRGFVPLDAPPGADVFVFNPHPHALRTTVDAEILLPNVGGEFGTTPAKAPLAAVDGRGRPLKVAVLATEAPVVRAHYAEATWGRRYRVRLTLDLPPTGYEVVRVFEAPQALPPAPAVVAACEALARALVLAWEPDQGDTYSFSPVSGGMPVDARLVRLRPHPRDAAAALATYRLDVPTAWTNARPTPIVGPPPAPDVRTVPLLLRVRLRDEGDAGVSLRIRYRNRARNGRLRVLLPTGLPATDVSIAGAHVGTTRRVRPEAVTPEEAPERYAGYPGELVYTTHPSRDLVLVEAPGASTEHVAPRAWIAHRGLPEYELAARSGSAFVAVTLCRSVGYLSVKGGRIRRVAAGPALATPGAQCLRMMGGDLLVGRGDVGRAEALQHARAFAHPAWAIELPSLPHAPAAGPVPRTASALRVETGDAWLSALRPETDGPGVVLRLANPLDAPQEVMLDLGGLLPGCTLQTCPTDLHERWEDAHVTLLPGARLVATLPPRGVRTWIVRAAP